MNFRCVIISLCFITGAAWGASNCESEKSNQAFNACLIKSLTSDFLPPKADNGQWVYSLHPNTEKQKRSTFIATLLSSSKIHYLDNPVALTVRCDDARTELEIHWDGITIKEGRVNITYHFDDELPQPAQWPLSLAQQSVYVSTPGRFIQTLATKRAFRVQISSQDAPTVSATFYLKGLKNLLPHMKGVCF
ncbi:hypothetical protein V6238_04250 [Marinomonas arenicola]|uniref:hypothetical protein n=1 Tax=Marinomonas arenicola TaxID=569601 RepID=UPI00311F5B17